MKQSKIVLAGGYTLVLLTAVQLVIWATVFYSAVTVTAVAIISLVVIVALPKKIVLAGGYTLALVTAIRILAVRPVVLVTVVAMALGYAVIVALPKWIRKRKFDQTAYERSLQDKLDAAILKKRTGGTE